MKDRTNKKQKTHTSMNKSASLTPVQGPSTVVQYSMIIAESSSLGLECIYNTILCACKIRLQWKSLSDWEPTGCEFLELMHNLNHKLLLGSKTVLDACNSYGNGSWKPIGGTVHARLRELGSWHDKITMNAVLLCLMLKTTRKSIKG
jgi:hypothetical protein